MAVIATPVSSVYSRVDGLSLSAIGAVLLILMGDFPLIVVEDDEILGSCHEVIPGVRMSSIGARLRDRSR
jgi:hypothetical protein